jgi:hypothetical protein
LEHARRVARERGVTFPQLVRDVLEHKLGPTVESPSQVRCAGVIRTGGAARRAEVQSAQRPIPLSLSTEIRIRTPGGGSSMGGKADLGAEVDVRERLQQLGGAALFDRRPAVRHRYSCRPGGREGSSQVQG